MMKMKTKMQMEDEENALFTLDILKYYTIEVDEERLAKNLVHEGNVRQDSADTAMEEAPWPWQIEGPEDTQENRENYISERIKKIEEKREELNEYFEMANDEELDSYFQKIRYSQKIREEDELQDEMSELIESFGEFLNKY